jgi:hypothetical protein
MGDRASADSLRWNLDLLLDQRRADMADLPGGCQRVARQGLQRQERGTAGDPHRPPARSRWSEFGSHERQAAEELEQWKADVEECKALDLSPGTFRCHRRPRNQAPERARRGTPRALEPAARWPGPGPGSAGADMADLSGGASGLLVRDDRGKEADRLVTRIAPGVVSLVAELRGHEREPAEELSQWRRTTRSVG